jgi:hypothetical protein
MTPEENRALDVLGNVTMRVASSGKRFFKDMCARQRQNSDFKMTARQARYLWLLVDLYRRQIRDERMKALGAHVKLTGELPPIYLEGDHAEPIRREKKPIKQSSAAVALNAPLPLFQASLFREG